ncbi:hypothetical protein [Herbiconiux sp. L3-i23]|uniref:hypothetical protein n=1 Tax=Herbiconiux sp. L3-i23 TaxID=2905871 RepID=UPI002073A2F8|nr:hypothetical protein [Herbiconiux sp. L3-i23]
MTDGPITVTIVNWGADGRTLSASGLVTGTDDADGVCTLTALAATGESLTGTVAPIATPEAVNCGVIDITAPAGEWTLVLAYESPRASGKSAPLEVVQP